MSQNLGRPRLPSYSYLSGTVHIDKIKNGLLGKSSYSSSLAVSDQIMVEYYERNFVMALASYFMIIYWALLFVINVLESRHNFIS